MRGKAPHDPCSRYTDYGQRKWAIHACMTDLCRTYAKLVMLDNLLHVRTPSGYQAVRGEMVNWQGCLDFGRCMYACSTKADPSKMSLFHPHTLVQLAQISSLFLYRKELPRMGAAKTGKAISHNSPSQARGEHFRINTTLFVADLSFHRYTLRRKPFSRCCECCGL